MTQIVLEGNRLAWYRQSAETPEFWEQHWRAHPPHGARHQPLPRWFARQIREFFPNDGLIIEAGCGNGALVRCLADHGYACEGLDFAPAAVDANRQVDPDGRYVVGDVRTLEYADDSIGGYISLGVIEHFRDEDERRRIVSEAFRCLRPGGVAMISTPYFNALRRCRAVARGFARRAEGESFYQFAFSRRDLLAQLRAVGFEIVDVDGYDVYKGVKDTIGGARLMQRYGAKSDRHAARLEQPARLLRRLAAHMILVTVRKPDRPGVAA